MWLIFALLLCVVGHADPSYKIGKLFCVPACPNRGSEHRDDLQNLIKNYHVRSFLLKQGTIKQAKDLIAWLKETASEPILIIVDAEWGLAMTIEDANSYPKHEYLSKLTTDEVYNIGKSIAIDCIDLGASFNLAPVVDVKLNRSCIIGSRSFGSDPKAVSAYAYAIAKGMQDNGLSICLKHFPGHGDVSLDSHKDLPTSHKTLEKLYKEDLLPYIKLRDLLPSSVMVSHILFTAIDPDYPASLSPKVISILKNLMKEDVLVISDALNMKALTNRYTIEEIAFLAFNAGVDLLLYGDHIAPNIDKLLRDDIPKAIQALNDLHQNNCICEKSLDKKVQKIKSLTHFQ